VATLQRLLQWDVLRKHMLNEGSKKRYKARGRTHITRSRSRSHSPELMECALCGTSLQQKDRGARCQGVKEKAVVATAVVALVMGMSLMKARQRRHCCCQG